MTGFFSPVFFVTVTLISAVVFVNGWTDAPNAVATCIASGAMPSRRAINMAAIFNFLGLVLISFFNNSVAKNISSSFSGGQNAQTVLCAAMTAIVLFAVFAWYFGVPTSESHALVAALSGAAVAEGGFSKLSVRLILFTVIGLFATCIMGLALGFFGKRILDFAISPQKQKRLKKMEIVSAALLAFIHGAHDGQKFLAVMIYGIALGAQGKIVPNERIITLMCGVLLALGTAIGGGRIIKKVGSEITAVDRTGGVSCDAAAFISIFICTLMGIPVSTTHTKTCAVLGVGIANKNINLKPLYEIFSLWLLTFPVCFIIGYVITKICL